MSSSSNGIPSFHINGMEGGVVGSSLMGFLCNLPSKGKKILDHLSISRALYIIFMDYAEVYFFAVCSMHIIIHLD